MLRRWWILGQDREYRTERSLAIYLFFLILVVSGEWLLADNFWLTDAINMSPQILYMMPGFLILGLALLRRRWLSASITMSLLGVSFFWFIGWSTGPGARANESERTPDTLRVMTYNVNGYENGEQNIAAMIDYMQPDIVFLQEADNYECDRLHANRFKAALKHYAVVFEGQIGIATNGKVVRRWSLPLINNDAVRPIQYAEIMVRGHKYTVANLHGRPQWYKFTIESGTYATKLSRFGKQNLEQTRQLLRDTPRDAIIGGDFNHSPRGIAYHEMREQYQNAFEVAGKGWGYTLIPSFPVQRIDHIWVPKSMKVLRAWVPQVFTSDHLAVVADIALPR